jgi:hypothetical protein
VVMVVGSLFPTVLVFFTKSKSKAEETIDAKDSSSGETWTRWQPLGAERYVMGEGGECL